MVLGLLACAIILNYLPAVFFAAGDSAFGFLLEDLQLFSIGVFGFVVCPVYKFYLKVLALLVACMLFAAMVHNALVNYDILSQSDSIFFSIIGQFTLFVILGYIWLMSFEWAKSDKFEKGQMHLVMGKPKSWMQWSVFVLTFGRTGTFSFTDGYSVWKFDKASDSFSKTKYEPQSIYGKKLLKTRVKPDKLDCMVGKKWGMLNNCLTVGLRYGK